MQSHTCTVYSLIPAQSRTVCSPIPAQSQNLGLYCQGLLPNLLSSPLLYSLIPAQSIVSYLHNQGQSIVSYLHSLRILDHTVSYLHNHSLRISLFLMWKEFIPVPLCLEVSLPRLRAALCLCLVHQDHSPPFWSRASQTHQLPLGSSPSHPYQERSTSDTNCKESQTIQSHTYTIIVLESLSFQCGKSSSLCPSAQKSLCQNQEPLFVCASCTGDHSPPFWPEPHKPPAFAWFILEPHCTRIGSSPNHIVLGEVVL